jgi:hypothetical protein
MKALKYVLIACSLSAALAHAQTGEAPLADENAQQVAQINGAHAAGRRATRCIALGAPKKIDNCVGPVSFCVMYYGR